MILQKRLAANIMKCGIHRVKFDPTRLDEIKGAITSFDVKKLITKGVINKSPERATSRGHARKVHAQKKKGLRRGHGSRKGPASSRENPKQTWMNSVRRQREYLITLKHKNNVDMLTYKILYSKIKGRFFRSVNHLKLFMEEQRLIKP